MSDGKYIYLTHDNNINIINMILMIIIYFL